MHPQGGHLTQTFGANRFRMSETSEVQGEAAVMNRHFQ
jgi:hypothetical protein